MDTQIDDVTSWYVNFSLQAVTIEVNLDKKSGVLSYQVSMFGHQNSAQIMLVLPPKLDADNALCNCYKDL